MMNFRKVGAVVLWGACFVLILALTTVEVAYFLPEFSPWRRLAAQFWLVTSVTVLVTAWGHAFTPFWDRTFWRSPRCIWYLIAFFLPPALILVDGGGSTFTSIDSEGSHQLMDGLEHLKGDYTLGVYRVGYYSYMDRQYMLNCLPSYFFGPSLWALRIGNSMFYIGGYFFFLASLQKVLRHRQVADPLFFTAYAGLMISLGGYAIVMARKFEQLMMPSGITFFFLGALMLYLIKPTPLRMIWLTWALGFCTYCYTPALGTWVLALAILLYFIIRDRHWIFIAAILYSFATLAITYLVEHRENALENRFDMGATQYTSLDWIWRYFLGFRAIVNADFSLIPPPLFMAIVAALYLAWRYRDRRFFFVCLWAFIIALCSLTLRGSNMRLAAFNVHRAAIILSPLTLGVVFLTIRYLSEPTVSLAVRRLIKITLGISMVYMVCTAVSIPFAVRGYMEESDTGDADEVMVDANRIITSHAEPLKKLYIVPPFDVDVEPTLHYFFPDAVVVRGTPPLGEKIPGTYVVSYRDSDPEARAYDPELPRKHPRPYLLFRPE